MGEDTDCACMRACRVGGDPGPAAPVQRVRAPPAQHDAQWAAQRLPRQVRY